MADNTNPTSTVSTTSSAVEVSDAPRITLSDLMASKSAPAPVPAAGTDVPEAPAVRLSPADEAEAARIAATIDFRKDGIESTYARDAQVSMSDFADGVLAKTTNKKTGEAGGLLRDLLQTVDDSELSGVRKVPIIGQVVVSIDKIRRSYQKVAPQVDEIVEKLQAAQSAMIADIAMFDTMYEKNVEQYRKLKVYIAGGRKALDDFNATQLPALEAEAQATTDPMGAQVLKDFKDKLARFAKRLDDLDRVSIVSLQMAPQIKLLQNADKAVSDKIDTTVSTTIPLWKSQMVIALGLESQRQALDLQKAVDDTTNKLLQANAAALHQGAVDAAKANERGSVDIETLQNVNQQLISTLRETMQIQAQGRTARQAAEVQMRQIEADLKQALLDNARSLG